MAGRAAAARLPKTARVERMERRILDEGDVECSMTRLVVDGELDAVRLDDGMF